MKKRMIAIIASVACLFILAGCSEETPPIPKVTAEQTQIPVTQSSYCWDKLGCVDYVGGKEMLKGVAPTVVAPESNINVSLDYKPAPAQLVIQQFQDEATIDVPFTDGYFTAPGEAGVYYYGLSAYWTTDDGKYSKGDTSSVFVIEVVSP